MTDSKEKRTQAKQVPVKRSRKDDNLSRQPDPHGVPSLPTLVYSHQVIGFTQVRADCTVTSFDITRCVNEAAKEMASQVEIDGFRKGKVPLKLIISHKWDSVEKRARDRLVEDAMNQITEEIGKEAHSPIAPPEVLNDDSLRIEKLEEEKGYAPLHFTITWPIDARNAMSPDMPDTSMPQQPEMPGMTSPAMPYMPGVPHSSPMPGAKGFLPKK